MKNDQEIIREIHDGLIRELAAYGFPEKQVSLVLKSLYLPIHKALQTKDEQCRQEKIKLVESIEPCCSTCDMWQFKGEQLIKLKSND